MANSEADSNSEAYHPAENAHDGSEETELGASIEDLV